jgi:hypothetical protein
MGAGVPNFYDLLTGFDGYRKQPAQSGKIYFSVTSTGKMAETSPIQKNLNHPYGCVGVESC